MKKTKENLLADYERVRRTIDSISTEHENYQMLLDKEDKIRSELIKLIQIESENKRDLIRNIVSLTTFGLTFAGGIWAVLASFEFDRNSTLTSTNGRNIITNFVSRTLMFKR